MSFNRLPVKIKNIRKRSKCGISVLRKTAGPSVSAIQKAPMDDSNTHMRSHRPAGRGHNSPNTQSIPVYARPAPSTHAGLTIILKAVGVQFVGQCWREPSGAEAWQFRVSGQLPGGSLSGRVQSWCTMLSVWLTETEPSWRSRCHWKVVLREPTSSSSFSCSLANSINTCGTKGSKESLE